MLTFTCKSAGSLEDLQAFRLVGPWSGKFKSLTTSKPRGSISAETRIEFENLVLILSNLNIGFTGTGPGCLAQILVELGAGQEAAEAAVTSREQRLHVERFESARRRDEKGIVLSRLGGDLVAMEMLAPYEKSNRTNP